MLVESALEYGDCSGFHTVSATLLSPSVAQIHHNVHTIGSLLLSPTSHNAPTCFTRGLTSSFTHSHWTHGRREAVLTAFGTFFELASSSSKNVAVGRQADRFGGQRQLGTLQKMAASRSGIRLNPRCGHGPVCRHARQWATPNGLESRTEHDARHGGRLS